jgi:hypothetical protein
MIKKNMKNAYDTDLEQIDYGKIQKERSKEQEDIEAGIKDPAAKVAPKPEEEEDPVVRINVSLTESTRKRLLAYAKKKKVPYSALIRLWIDEHCD